MDLRKLSEPLRTDQIDFRVQSVNNGGYATILAYKDARCDMQRLDDVCGPLNWKREHVNGNHNCIVSVWSEKTKQWVSKEDTGTASNAEAEKGLASDSFKRACFNWGIGRELYDYPVISIKLNSDEIQERNGKKAASYKLRLREWRWRSKFAGNQLVYLAAMDTNNQIRFEWGDTAKAKAAAMIMSHYQADDAESLVDFMDESDNDFIAEVWKLFQSSDRSAITKMINEERKARKEEGQ